MLRPYQRRAADFLKENRSCNLWLDMGLGKTLSVLTALAELPRQPVLVVAPKKVAESVWGQEIDKWKIPLTYARCLGTPKQREAALEERSNVTIINRENLVWLYEHMGSRWPWRWVILDESDSFKDSSTKRFKALRMLRRNGLIQHVTNLTGTPAGNGYLNLWAPQWLVDQGSTLGTTLSSYQLSYFNPGARNGHVVYNWTLKPGAKDIITAKLKHCTISMKSEDYLTLPDMLVNDVPVQLTDKELKAYKHYKETAVTAVADETFTATTAATLANRLLQWTSGFQYGDEMLGSKTIRFNEHKLEALGELIEAQLGKPLLIFHWFKEDEKEILTRFKARKLETMKDVDDWNAGKIPVMLAHPMSAGHGLNLQHGGSSCVWYSLPFSLAAYQQANKRLHRSGQKENVTVHRLIMKGTIDEHVARILEAKDATQADLINAVKAVL